MSKRCNSRLAPAAEPESEMLIPIVGNGGGILGWTDKAPEYHGITLRHAEAEALLGRTISCGYIEIERPADAERAGAPPGWNGPWRCLALCGADAIGVGRAPKEIAKRIAGRVGSRGTARRLDH